MSKVGKQIISGLKDAVRHARCTNRHVEHHVTTKTSEREFTTECMKCGHSWITEDRGDWHKPIRVVRPTS